MDNSKKLFEFIKSRYLYKNILYSILFAFIVNIFFYILGISFEIDKNTFHFLFWGALYFSILNNYIFSMSESELLMECFKITFLIFISVHYIIFKLNKIKFGYIFTILFTIVNIIFWFMWLSFFVT